MPRELILLSPYTPPTQHALMIGIEETNSWLNAWSALWHPAAIANATAPPKWASPYDYDPPVSDHLYAIPESPPLYLAGDWDDRIREVRAAAFRANQSRESTLEHLQAALAELGAKQSAGAWSDTDLRPFFGIGLAYLSVETLFDAMEHEHLLDREGFWTEMQAAARDHESRQSHLQNAVAKLQSARNSLYPVNIHLLDFAILDEKYIAAPLPAAITQKSPINVITSGEILERLAKDFPDRAQELMAAANSTTESRVEICGGPFRDREDELLSVESQLWNLRRGLDATEKVLGRRIQTYASARGSFHPQTPLILQQVGISKSLLLSFDDARLPVHKAAVIQWSTSDGRQIEAFSRTPLPADDPQTFFHLAHHLHQTIMQDQSATLALVHRPNIPAAPWYEDWLALSSIGPVLGAWTTMSSYLQEGVVGEYASPATADDFAIDALEARCGQSNEKLPISPFARHMRMRRRLDAAATYVAIHCALGGEPAAELHHQLADLEDRIERFESVPSADLETVENLAASPLVARLLNRATQPQPGLMLLNSCAFARRVALERDDFQDGVASGGAIKAIQHDSGKSRLVAEIPALGFAWLPRTACGVEPQSRIPNPRAIKLADQHVIRNEYFEAEIDPATGGLRSIRDTQSRENRMGQQLVFQPGSKTVVKEIQVTSAGPALGEIVSTGALMDNQEAILATFRQRFRAWLGRPLLELRIELFVEHRPQGYPWHAYFGSRFAWRDERATLLRGVCGQGAVTTHSRPTTPDYLELRSGRHRTLLLPGGLPFHQRHGARMLDVILVPQGETVKSFDLAIGLNREQPMQTAWGFTSPILAVPVDKGPPHIGQTGWLFHLDAPNLLLTSLTANDASAAVTARMMEVAGYSGGAELRCPRNPKSAAMVDALGESQQTLHAQGDAVQFDYAEHGLMNVRIEF